MDAFDRLFGSGQGRIEPVNASAFDGDWVFCLGSDLAGAEWDLNPNDGIELSQAADITGLKLVRFKAHLRAPETMPAARGWYLRWFVGAVEQSSILLEPGEELDIEDGAFDVSQVTGTQTLKFVLRLEVTP